MELISALSVKAELEVLALAIAKDAYPNLSFETYLRKLDQLATPLVVQRLGLESIEDQARALSEHLFQTVGLQGNESDYYDPRNSYLNDVLDRKTGIPISLAVVVIAVGRRAGISVEGVAFPGHFLVRVGGTHGMYLDPFFGGRVIDEAALERLATKFLGSTKRLKPEHLEAVDERAVVVRMLVNLKHAHERRQDHSQALVVSDRLVDITASATFKRDRGLHALALGASHQAVADLEAYLEDTTSPADEIAVRRALEKARGKSRNLVS